MTTSDTTSEKIFDTTSNASMNTTSGARKAYLIAIVVTSVFIFVQSLTAGEFISDGLAGDAKEAWTTVHGLIAYPVMVAALITAVIAVMRLRSVGLLAGASIGLFLATVAQWLSGHAISTLGMDWVTPIHVMLAFVVYGLAIWLCARGFVLRRAPR